MSQSCPASRAPRQRVAALACAALVLCANPDRAHASHEAGYSDFGRTIGYTMAGIGAAVGAAGLTTLVINSAQFGTQSPSWRYAGYVFGIQLALAGLGTMASAAAVSSERAPMFLWPGAAGVALGAANILVSYFSGRSAERKQARKISLVPLLAPGARGTLAAGVGLQVVGW